MKTPLHFLRIQAIQFGEIVILIAMENSHIQKVLLILQIETLLILTKYGLMVCIILDHMRMAIASLMIHQIVLKEEVQMVYIFCWVREAQ